ncbi:MAG: hypothetical protein AAF889_10145 [Cyanobacteria bacterium P01_D01_bin.73]
MAVSSSNRRFSLSPRLLIERGLILLAWLNLGLVTFNISYVPLRSFYLRAALFMRDRGEEQPWLGEIVGPPGDVALFYDPIKGIEPERDTQRYLQAVNKLTETLELKGLESDEIPPLLQDLQIRSAEMIAQNPFAIADKTGTLEQIKNRMSDHMEIESSTRAFNRFWSTSNLKRKGWQDELEFFDNEIRFPMQTNYFRKLGEDGSPADFFGIIDTPFVILFAIDFIFRTFRTKRRYKDLTWSSAAFSHWQDLLFLLPFWRWSRIIPVISRSNEANFPNLEGVRKLVGRSFVASFATELTEVVVVEVVGSVQRAVKSGVLSEQLLKAEGGGYVEINDVNEVQAITDRVLTLCFNQVLPEIRPDLEAFLNQQIQYVMSQSPAYQGLTVLPGMDQLPRHLAQQLASSLAMVATGVPKVAYETVTSPLDPKSQELLETLIESGGDAFRTELAKPETQEELQGLIWDLLEELKLSYVRRSPEKVDSLELLEQTAQLRRKARSTRG